MYVCSYLGAAHMQCYCMKSTKQRDFHILDDHLVSSKVNHLLVFNRQMIYNTAATSLASPQQVMMMGR
jgi:hypothetical protein